MASSCRDFLTNYRTTKYVIIKSGLLRIPYLLALGAVAAYAIFWMLGVQLGIMAGDSVSFRPVGLVQKPMKNWWNCTDNDIDCFVDLPKETPLYCNRNDYVGDMMFNSKYKQRRIKECYHEDIHGKHSDSFFIPTMLTHIDQTWSDQWRDWVNMDTNDYYWFDIESHFVSFLHAFSIPGRHALDSSVFASQGFIMGPNITSGVDDRLMIPTLDDVSIGEESSLAREISRLEGYPLCDEELPGNCSSTRWGDFLSVRTILAAAGVALDSPRKGVHKSSAKGVVGSNELMTYRMAGFALEILVYYNNYEVVYKHLWQDFNIGRFLNPPSRYTYKVSISETFKEHTVMESKVTHPFDDDNKRRVTRLVGIFVTLRGEGKVGHFSLSHVLIQLSISFSLIAVARYTVEQILTKIYQISNPKAAYMWEHYAEEHTLDEQEFETELREALGDNVFDSYSRIARARHGLDISATSPRYPESGSKGDKLHGSSSSASEDS